MKDDAKTGKTRRHVSVQVQSILFHMNPASIERSLESLARAAELAIYEGECASVHVSYGDTSASPCLDEAQLEELRQRFPALDIDYQFFKANLGSARGHNRLAENATADYLLILNPDVVVSPRLLGHMLSPFDQPGVGMVEAKQIPVEHPKDYNPLTGETGWATTACALTPAALFHELDGFDADSFFLYCDDVDYSWRVREAGYKVIFMPAAVAFHDKRLSVAGNWLSTGAERYYSAEAALFMAHKWSRPDLVELFTCYFRDGSEDQRKALRKFEERRKAGELPEPRDPDHKIGEFVDGMYTRHRYPL